MSSTEGLAFLGPMPPGVHQLNVSRSSPGGRWATRSFVVLVDGSSPVFGDVHVGENAAYWGVGNEVICSFDAASDAESGIDSYVVTIVEASGVCGGPQSSGYAGEVRASIIEECSGSSSFAVALSATFVHGGQYRCVVTTTNGAGVATTRSSPDFLVDLSAAELGLGQVQLLQPDADEAMSVTSNLSLRVAFEANVDLESSIESAFHTAVNGPIPSGVILPLSPVDFFTLQLQRYEPANSSGSNETLVEAANVTASMRLGALSSPCCATALPAGPQAAHDAWLVPDGWPSSATSSMAALGSSHVLLATAEQLLIRSTDGAGVSSQELFPLSALISCADGTPRGDVHVFGSASNAGPWALAACGIIRVYTSVAPGWVDSGFDLPIGCSGGEVVHMALRADRAFLGRLCPSSTSGTAASIVQVPLAADAVPLQVSAGASSSASAARASVASFSTHDALLAVPKHDDCVSGGAVSLYTIATAVDGAPTLEACLPPSTPPPH